MASDFRQLPVDQLIRGQFQPRQHFDEDELFELAQTIKATNGLLQPIVVRELAQNRYEIVAGERRWRAAILAGLDEVSCLVRHFDDHGALAAAIIENVSRSDLNPIEEAHAYQRLMTEFQYTHECIAHSVGKSRTKITNTLRLLKLPQQLQRYLIEGLLSEGHGKILVTLPDHLQLELADLIIKKGWSVRKIEQEVRLRLATPPASQPDNKDTNIKALEKALSDHIGCQVAIDWQKNQGKLAINFHNLDVLEGLFTKLGFEFNKA